jgi:hypothetical protein
MSVSRTCPTDAALHRPRMALDGRRANACAGPTVER